MSAEIEKIKKLRSKRPELSLRECVEMVRGKKNTYMPQARLTQERMQLVIDKKHCDDCHFFTHHGNMEENFCGLYMRHTDNDKTKNGNYRSEKRPRPKFCKDQIIDLRVK